MFSELNVWKNRWTKYKKDVAHSRRKNKKNKSRLSDVKIYFFPPFQAEQQCLQVSQLLVWRWFFGFLILVFLFVVMCTLLFFNIHITYTEILCSHNTAFVPNYMCLCKNTQQQKTNQSVKLSLLSSTWRHKTYMHFRGTTS